MLSSWWLSFIVFYLSTSLELEIPLCYRPLRKMKDVSREDMFLALRHRIRRCETVLSFSVFSLSASGYFKNIFLKRMLKSAVWNFQKTPRRTNKCKKKDFIFAILFLFWQSLFPMRRQLSFTFYVCIISSSLL